MTTDHVCIHFIEAGDFLNDGVGRGEKIFLCTENITNGTDGGIHIHLCAGQLLHSHDLVDYTFDLTDVGGDILGHERKHCIVNGDAALQRFVFQNGHSGFVIGRLYVSGQTLFKPGFQTLFQTEHFLGRTVGSENDLLMLFIQGVERMEQFFLTGVLTGNELYVVHEE